MKWFKHMTTSCNDEKLAAYLSENGLEGYGFWWLLMEVVAAQCVDDKCSATYPLPHWSRLLYCHHNKVGKYLGKLEATGIVKVEYIEGKIRVTIPNILKYRDEYSRKSGQNQESVRPKKEKEIQNKETDREKPTTTTTRAQDQLAAAIQQNRAKLITLFPDINLPVATEKLLYHYRGSPTLLAPYATVLKWFQSEFPQKGGANGHRHSGSAKASGAKTGFFEANPAGTDFLS